MFYAFVLLRRCRILIRKVWRNHLFSRKTASNFRIKTICVYDSRCRSFIPTGGWAGTYPERTMGEKLGDRDPKRPEQNVFSRARLALTGNADWIIRRYNLAGGACPVRR
jgi:hypothetical protein